MILSRSTLVNVFVGVTEKNVGEMPLTGTWTTQRQNRIIENPQEAWCLWKLHPWITPFLGKCEHLLTPDRETMEDQSTDATKVQLGKPVSLVEEWPTGIWAKSYVQEQANSRTGAASAAAHPSMNDCLPENDRNLGCTAQPAGSFAGLRMSFAGNLGDGSLFQKACPITASRQLSWSEPLLESSSCQTVTVSHLFCLYTLGVESGNGNWIVSSGKT